VPRPDRDGDAHVLERPESKTRTPKLYRVLLLNDDYTTMEFVIHVLESIFDKGPAEAYRIMMEVHTRGRGACGAYTYEVAETKVAKVHEEAVEEGFPLRADMEEA
jgi:ATP-dependent Clp protease adaptor protein ClpS